MPISDTQIRTSYTGNGSSVSFPIPFKFYLDTDITVMLGTAIQASGYSITGGEDASGSPQNGTVVFSSPPAEGVAVQFILDVPLTQLVNLVDGTGFPSSTLNQVNDRAIQGLLRLNDILGRAIVAPDGDVLPSLALPNAGSRANTFLGFDINGDVSLGKTLPSGTLSQSSIGQFLNPRTDAETSANVTPVNYAYSPGYVDRYGINTHPGITDMTSAIQAALNVANLNSSGQREVILLAGTYLTGTITWPGNNITLKGASSSFSYDSGATPRTVLSAKPGTTVILNISPLGVVEDRQGNYVCDLQVSGNGIAAIGIDTAFANVFERVLVTGCTTAGIRTPNFGNANRMVRCSFSFNTGWGAQILGVSTTTYSFEECQFEQNTLGGLDLEAGVLVSLKKCIVESNNGPGLRIYNGDFKGFYGFDIDTCWFEDNASNSPFFTIVISGGTSDLAHSPSRINFKNCRFSTASTRKWLFSDISAWVKFEDCNFTGSSAADAITLDLNARYMSFLGSSSTTTAVDGISATQMDNAIAQGIRCYWNDIETKRIVGSGSPAAVFQNGWSNYGSGFTSAGYWFDRDGNVCLQGSVKNGIVGASCFTLPVGYRPNTQKAYSINSNGAFGLVYINTDGTVVPQVGSNVIFSLDGVCFPTG